MVCVAGVTAAGVAAAAGGVGAGREAGALATGGSLAAVDWARLVGACSIIPAASIADCQ
jgi:hypothetical protein